jgi:hypothetical protein
LTGGGQVDQGEQLAALLDDASRFALRNRHVVDEAPLQTYMSALLFAPSLSKVRQMFGNGLRKYFEITCIRASRKHLRSESRPREINHNFSCFTLYRTWLS